MEIVLTFLAVILLVVLPVAFLLLMVWGLFHGISRAFRGDKRENARTVVQGPPSGKIGEQEPSSGEANLLNNGKSEPQVLK